MALTAGQFQIGATCNISGATIAPQGTAPSTTLQSPQSQQTATGSSTLEFGTTTSKADILCAGEFKLTTGATLTLDLYTGTDFKDLFGYTAAFRKIKGIFVSITSGGDASGLTIGGAASNANKLFFGTQNDTWTIYPSGAPFAGGSPAGVVVDSTHKNLLLTNNSAVDIIFKLFLAGTSS